MTAAEEREMLELEAQAHEHAAGQSSSEAPSYGESALRGAAQGATLGFADELAGAGHAAMGAARKMSTADIVKDYIANRDAYRAADAGARKANPKTFGATEFGGGVATAFIPGMNIGKAATLGGRALGAAGLGAVTGLGSSEADLTKGDVVGAARDTALGGAIGGVAAPVIEKAVVPIASAAIRGAGSAAGWAGKKFMNTALDVPEAVSTRYLNNPDAVNNSHSFEGLGQKLADTLGEVREDTGPLHEATLAQLSNVRKPDEGFALHRSLKLLRDSGDKKALELADKLEGEYRSRSSGGLVGNLEPHADYLSERELHDVKSRLQKVANDYKSPLPDEDLGIARSNAYSLNDTLKTGNKGYENAIGLEAENIQAKKDLAKKFAIIPDFSRDASPSGFTFSDRTIGNLRDVYKQNKFERSRVLESLKDQGYGDLANNIENTLARETLEGGGRPNGSRKAVMWGTQGGALGQATGIPGGGWTGSAIGATLGATMDKYGPTTAKKGMDAALAIQRFSNKPALQKFIAPVQAAAARGQGAVATTLFLLQQTEPLVNEALNNPED